LPKFTGYFWASSKFPGYFQDFAKFPGCFQDYGVGVVYFIPKPGFLYLFRCGTLFLTGKRKNPGWAMCKIFP
jgi:hypothetical protein